MDDQDRHGHAPIPLRVLQVNALDRGGGAEYVAWTLFDALRQQGDASWLAAGVKKSRDPDVFQIENDTTANPWAKMWWRLQKLTYRFQDSFRHGERLRRIVGLLAEPASLVETLRGYETSRFPGTYRLLDLPPARPNIVNLHTLHRGYFELEALPALSHRVPTVLTLHDAWLLSGHCMHSFGCERWRTGCGDCPDLTIPPRVLRDATARNWVRKRDIFARSRLWITTPSRWLMDKVDASMLSGVEQRVIPLGIDDQVFTPIGRAAAREALGLPQHVRLLMFAANRPQFNPWKDYNLLLEVFERLRAAGDSDDLHLLVVGGGERGAETPSAGITLVPYQPDPAQLARYYAAADIFVYPTKVETFGAVLTEAMACGTPVVATRITGIPEQVIDGETGFLTAPGDAAEMAARIRQILADDALRRRMSIRARENVERRFALARMIADYRAWYAEIVARTAAEN